MRQAFIKFLFFILVLHVCAWKSYAQLLERKVYPQPKMTDEVKYIQSLRHTYQPRETDDIVLPTSIDNSKKMFFPPILNQSGGSCAQASGIGYMFTYEFNRYLGRDAKASADNRFSYLFSWNMINDGEDQGGFVDQGLFLAQRYGMMTEADYGVSSTFTFKWASGYEKYLRAMHYRTKQIIQVADSVPLIKRYLYEGGILTFSMQSLGWKINDNYQGSSETGYKSLLTKLATDGAHALTIAGYDDLVTFTDDTGIVHTGAFIVVNSWGSYSHDNGHFYLPYYFFRHKHSSLELGEKLVGVSVTEYEPLIVYKVNIDYTSRNDLSFGMAATANATATAPSTAYTYCYAFRRMGGDIKMQGAYRNSDIELAFDFPVSAETADTYKKYFLNVLCQKNGELGTGFVQGIDVFDYRFEQPRVYTCHAGLGTPLHTGSNLFTIPIAPLYSFSASSYNYFNDDKTLSNKTYLVRTARGHQAKMQFIAYDETTGEVTLRYAVFK